MSGTLNPRHTLTAYAALAVISGITVAAQNPRDRHNVGPETFTSRTVASGLDNPWDIAWGPDDQLWVTERTGFRVTRVNPVDGSKRVLLVIDDVYQSVVQDGLLGLALHPELLRGRGTDHVFVGLHLRPRPWACAAFTPPLATLFTVPADYDFTLGAATIAPAGIDIYTAPAIPGWANSILITGMRAGSLYRVKLGGDSRSVSGEPVE